MMTVIPPEDMTAPQLRVWIDLLTCTRTELRRERQPVGDIDAELSTAWDLLRRRRAEAVHGTADSINRRARVEREIAKLAGET